MLFTIFSVLSLITFSFEFIFKNFKINVYMRGVDLMKIIIIIAIGCGMGLYDGSKREQIKLVRN